MQGVSRMFRPVARLSTSLRWWQIFVHSPAFTALILVREV